MTKKLMVGKVAVGGGAPVSIQSMCNTKTDDVAATVAQIHALEDVQAIRGSLLKQTKFILRKSAVLPFFSRPRFVQRR